MKSYFTHLVIALFAVVIFTPDLRAASSSLQLEPYIGYGPLSISEGIESDTKMGPTLGGYGGFLFGSIYLALDYHTGGLYDLPKLGIEVAQTLFGAGFAYIGSGWKIWLGYYPSNRIEDFERLLEYTGVGYKLSIGWKLKSKLTFSINHITNDWSEKNSTTGFSTATGSADGTQTYLTVSAPIKIL